MERNSDWSVRLVIPSFPENVSEISASFVFQSSSRSQLQQQLYKELGWAICLSGILLYRLFCYMNVGFRKLDVVARVIRNWAHQAFVHQDGTGSATLAGQNVLHVGLVSSLLVVGVLISVDHNVSAGSSPSRNNNDYRSSFHCCVKR